jgi:cystathionine beta-lyase
MSKAVTPAELRGRGGLKWTGHEERVLAAWVAEMDFGLAPAIKEALHDAVERGDTAYFYPSVTEDAARAATSYWSDTFGWDLDPNAVFPAPDVVEGIRRAIVHLTRPGSGVILHTPVYFPFFSMVERSGRDLLEIPSLREDDGVYRLDLAQIDRAFEDGAGSIVLCNPWNPTGKAFSREELDEIIELARKHDARVISDEIHAPISYRDSLHIPAASIAPETVITVTSASKAWNLPGLKCAQIFLTNEADAEYWREYYTPDKVGVGTFGLIANAAAYSRSREWFAEVMDRLHHNRELLGELVAELLPGVGYRKPDATYLAWLDFSEYGMDDPALFCLEEAEVALTGGGPFGQGGSGHARLNFATHPHILTEIVERIASALNGAG